ncbi:Clr6 I prime and Rpd3L histone deacetylase complex subunit Pst1 [Schizosaccharomyces pombe]|uniref:Paired amphipathic helix protein pst1 n=1 Tax=Schizosaccharomyces pombe (strain 972 / ATCC 24843) TaxID=284812 RepID=PST1_SCHPO|nr:Clr6 histone deacetylase complex subunit Pst1 [Schizosaccharomyces pombe]Q09750.1 RecName: Full=Paired amphipathic helix protein pst1; AltName: Full=SIN3 homolog 1 [Schizosaccharomyces pombe 972h-]AAF90180.1 corepressor Pst1p [Schizosaccharomyces pombe]8I03_A Chain A, Paired amphipathic helix protein pst1 [Schizosaccharomyces pombe]CAA20757.2 Clr6 histone deacetylase complex subunit Pst1 [Schizosaccharomyces pombe]|eukprot:NP_596012.2 Clr6 histone deacetylase complex subunit Pst1 [Schizosaccharomyces pombe]
MAKDWQDARLGQCHRLEDYSNVAINYTGPYLTPSGTMAYHPGNAPLFTQAPPHTNPQGPPPFPLFNSISPVYDPATGRLLYRNVNTQVSHTAIPNPANGYAAVYGGPPSQLPPPPQPQSHPNVTVISASPARAIEQQPTILSSTDSNIPRPGTVKSSASPFVPNQNPSAPPPPPQEYRQLNVTDALSYLDLVKLQFHQEPEIYNEFLDIMKEFKSQAIETPEVITRVSKLFAGYPNLIQGFNTFLPPGYSIEISSADPGSLAGIHITTPQGPLMINDLGKTTAPPPPHGSTTPLPAAASYTSMNMKQSSASHPVLQPPAPSTLQFNPSPSPAAPSYPPVDASVKQAADLDQAINFVNNVKNRFSHKPEAYNSFLDILKSYQHDQRPIQLVYFQVSQLFAEAPDLLEEFKRFLPDVSVNAPAETQDKSTVVPQESATATPKRSPSATPTSALPPIGKFAPPTTAKAQPAPEKRRGEPAVQTRNHSKRTRTATSSVEETTPRAFNVPIAQNKNPSELEFLEHARQYLANESKYNEFIKLLELYSQEVFDKNALVERCYVFFGSNEHLMNWLKDLVKYNPANPIPVPRPRVDLTQCKSCGPSYRLLPKIELLLPCSGRDDLCWTILNDAWVSFPTLASEDSGFIAHRKNQFEENLHKLEEERYEYDRHIGANMRFIELLQIHADKMLKMSEVEKANWTLPSNLGGKSVSIYHKVIKKVYGKEHAQQIIENLQKNPSVTIPIVLERLKKKDREWRSLQNHWNELWHDIEEKNFYRSLDHQGVSFKSVDKKSTTPKFLISELRNLAQQQKVELSEGKVTPSHQFLFSYKDPNIITDIARLFGVFLIHGSTHSAEDNEKMSNFLRSFLSLFFDVPYDSFIPYLPTHFNEEESDIDSLSSSLIEKPRASSSPIHHANNNGLRLLKDVLKKTYRGARENRSSVKEDYVSESTERTPDASEIDEHISEHEENDDESSSVFSTGEVWVNCKFTDTDGSLLDDGTKLSDRSVYNLFGNMSLYCFFRLFHTLYSRLEEIKNLEQMAYSKQHDVKSNPVAVELGLVRHPSERLGFALPTADTVYEQAIQLCERLMEGEIDQNGFEDALRCLYGIHAFRLYTVEKLVTSIIKQLHSVTTNRRLAQVFMYYEKDRVQRRTSPRQQIMYRIQTETAFGPDENLCCIDWNSQTRQSAIRLMGREDLTMGTLKSDAEKWCYYIGSYIMSSPTEGILPEHVRIPFLRKCLPSDEGNEDDESSSVVKSANAIITSFLESGLALTIPINTVKIRYENGTEDVFARNSEQVYNGPYDKIRDYRQSKWREWLNSDEGWTQGLSKDKVRRIKPCTIESLFNESTLRSGKAERFSENAGVESIGKKGKNLLNESGNGKKLDKGLPPKVNGKSSVTRGNKTNLKARNGRNNDDSSNKINLSEKEKEKESIEDEEKNREGSMSPVAKHASDVEDDHDVAKSTAPDFETSSHRPERSSEKKSPSPVFTSVKQTAENDADNEDDKTDMDDQTEETLDADNTMEEEPSKDDL